MEVYYTLVNYEGELEEISLSIQELLAQQEQLLEQQEQLQEQLQDTSEAIVQGTGVMSALVGMLIGFFAMVELLKVWLE